MAKLTKAQISALEGLAAGDEVWTNTGVRYSAFWLKGTRKVAPLASTLIVLRRLGLIDRALDGTGERFTITPAGRDYLAKSQDSKEG